MPPPEPLTPSTAAFGANGTEPSTGSHTGGTEPGSRSIRPVTASMVTHSSADSSSSSARSWVTVDAPSLGTPPGLVSSTSAEPGCWDRRRGRQGLLTTNCITWPVVAGSAGTSGKPPKGASGAGVDHATTVPSARPLKSTMHVGTLRRAHQQGLLGECAGYCRYAAGLAVRTGIARLVQHPSVTRQRGRKAGLDADNGGSRPWSEPIW